MASRPTVTYYYADMQGKKLVRTTHSNDPDWATARAEFHIRTQRWPALVAIVVHDDKDYSSVMYHPGTNTSTTIYWKRFKLPKS